MPDINATLENYVAEKATAERYKSIEFRPWSIVVVSVSYSGQDQTHKYRAWCGPAIKATTENMDFNVRRDDILSPVAAFTNLDALAALELGQTINKGEYDKLSLEEFKANLKYVLLKN